MRFVSLKTKFVILCVCLSTGTTGLLGSYLVWNAYHSLRLQAQQSQLAMAKALAWNIDQGVSRAFQAVEVLSKQREITGLKKTTMERELTLVTSATELLDCLLVVDTSDRISARSLSTFDPKNFPPSEWFGENRAKIGNLKNSVLLDVYQTKNENLGVAIAAPIRNPADGQSIGMLVGLLYLPNHTIGNLDDIKIGNSGYAYLVNEDGATIMHPNKQKLLEDLSQTPAVKALRDKGEGILQFKNQDGREILAAFSRVESARWGVVIRQPADECYEPAQSMLRITSIFLFLTLLLSAVISTWVARRVVHPILKLASSVKKFESGKGSLKNLGKSNPSDEVGLLNQAISRMASRLEIQGMERERSHQRALTAEKKLSQSKRLAAVGQLAAGLAHELNNPLAVIFASTRLAEKSSGRPLKKWHHQILKEAERCRKLVANLLDYAKPMKIRSRQFDMVPLAEECWNQVLPVAGQQWSMEISPKTFPSRIDPDRFKQVFLNLMANSLQAMPNGGKLRIRFEKKEGSTKVILEDEGFGFSTKESETIFQPFFTTKSGGTGLGLPIVRSILQAHGGSIRAEPLPQKGSRFVMEWPSVKITHDH